MVRYFFFFFFFFTLTFLLTPAFSQEYSYIHYDVKDGLAGSTVYCMAQDKEGFVWFGTETGLSRFDGTHFKNFTKAEGLPDNEIIKIFADSKGRVWLIPFKNAIAYYWKGHIYNEQNDTLLAKLKIASEVESVMEDDAGNTIVTEYIAVHIISPAGKITDIKEFEGKPITALRTGLNKKSAYTLAVPYNMGLALLNVYGNKLVKAENFGPATPNNYNSVYIDPRRVIYENQDSLFIKNSGNNTKFSIFLPNGFISIAAINDTDFTLNTRSGSFLLSLGQRKITDTFLKGQTVNSAIEDAEGDLWFSTLGKGVYRLASTEVGIYSFRKDNNVMPVFCIQKFDSTLYVGTDHFSLWALDLNSKRIRNALINDGFTRGRITAIIRKNKKNLIVGTDDGLFQFSGFGKKTIRLWRTRSVKSLSLINDTTVLECSGISTQTIRLDDSRFVDSIWRARATYAYGENGIYYIGTLDGLYMVDVNKRATYLGDLYPVFKNRIAAICRAPDGILWIATDGEGLAGYKDGKIVSTITQANGLTSNICRAIFVWAEDIWVGTDKGLNKITWTDGNYKIIPFTSADGLPSDIINTIYVDDKGVYAGTSEGVAFFNEKRISKRSYCELRITGITVSGKEWSLDTTGFLLPHKNNDIQFDFVGISYKSAGNINYHYRLAGLDTAWKTTGETTLNYLSLPSGIYELQLFAINKFGVRSETSHIKFTIDKLLWEKTGFRILCAVLLASIIWLLVSYRIKMIRKKEMEKSDTFARIAELEQMALRSQMNPHFIFNSLNSIQQYVMDKDVRGANEFITNFSRLIRLTLDISSKPRICLQEEADYISTYLELEKRRFESKFIYKIRIADEIDLQEFYIPPMILQPYVENSIRHGIGHRQDMKGSIEVRMELTPDALVCIIEDNGVGRKKAMQFKGRNVIEYQSKGMNLTEKRIEMLNISRRSYIRTVIEDLEDEDRKPSGTRITIYFPLQFVME